MFSGMGQSETVGMKARIVIMEHGAPANWRHSLYIYKNLHKKLFEDFDNPDLIVVSVVVPRSYVI